MVCYIPFMDRNLWSAIRPQCERGESLVESFGVYKLVRGTVLA